MPQVSALAARKALAQLRKETGYTPSGLINLLRGGGGSGKGSEYEREMCKLLSMWWTGEARDDVFWRSSGSGGRAKARGRAGVATMGQHGDVSATDPIGQPLIDLLTIEIKRGYSEYTVQDMFDRQPEGGVQVWEGWCQQAMESAAQAGSISWMLITRRDRRVPLAWVPAKVFKKLRLCGAWPRRPSVLVRVSVRVRTGTKKEESSVFVDMYGMMLSEWLYGCTPAHIKDLLKEEQE